MALRPLSFRTAIPLFLALLLLMGAATGLELSTPRGVFAVSSLACAVALLVLIALRGLILQEETEAAAQPLASIEPHWVDESITTPSAVTELLEEIAGHAYRILQAESVELYLYDGDNTGFHSSFVVGLPTVDEAPFGAQKMTPPQHGEKAEQDLVFARERLGKMIVKLPAGATFSATARQTLKTIAMHGVMVLINARYSQELIKMRSLSDIELQVRSGFLGNLSHEIRGPLGIILNASELVLEGLCGPLTADQIETLGMVRINSEHLMELITDVLDYAKIESGKMNPTPVALTVNDQLLELSRMVRAQADAKRHVVRCRDASEEPAVQCDRRHFRQMMLNLLTNAIKYTPDGGTIEIWSEKGDAGLLKICVRDSGVGISEKDRSRVFTPFERLQHAYSSTQQGTGLGLSLTKRLAEINGGSVHFDSVVNVGTTFWIELPSTRAERALSTADQLPHHPVRSSGEQILIAGSGDEERILLSRYLRGLGYGVHMVEDERAARGILRTNTIALVIFGEGFRPEVEGTLANFVRDEQGTRYIPVVLLTRSAFLVDVERYLREDIDRCLTKPVRLEELAVACRQAIDLTRGG